ncbi:CHRD domain-containing protein [Sunxiuqinia sp. A32]|uniref:CHRD domain-containing protein n=1 Tax=Sunxiuqinia sp. A32 TaxID=3461496 RepID=UPI00404653AE
MKTITNTLTSKRLFSYLMGILFVGFLISCSEDESDDMETASKITYSGEFVKSAETVTTSAMGTVNATFDPTTLVLSYAVTWSGLGSEVANMHFHNAGPVLSGITGFSTAVSGTVSGNTTLTSEEANDLASGNIYVQIHTANYPGGEILATLTKKSSPNSSNDGGGYGY